MIGISLRTNDRLGKNLCVFFCLGTGSEVVWVLPGDIHIVIDEG